MESFVFADDLVYCFSQYQLDAIHVTHAYVGPVAQLVESLKDLTVTVTGTEWATTKWADNSYSEHHEFFSCEIPIASFIGDSLEPGNYTWPFTVMLQPDLPSTMKVR